MHMPGLHIHMVVNPCAAELLVFMFPPVQAEIGNAISSFKWRKIALLVKDRHFLKLNYLIYSVTTPNIFLVS